MQEVKAFQCEHTGAIFASQADAVRCEFKAKMRVVAETLPAFGSVNVKSMMEWLADNLASSIYKTALPALTDALAYLAEHQKDLEPKPKEQP
jgi:hypothetical protein